MRITQAGIYVQIQKYGIEGLVSEDPAAAKSNGESRCTKIVPDVEQERAELQMQQPNGRSGPITVSLFDHLKIQVKAEIVEFRRSLNLHCRGKLSAAKNDVDKDNE